MTIRQPCPPRSRQVTSPLLAQPPCLARQCHSSLSISPNCKNSGARGQVQSPITPSPPSSESLTGHGAASPKSLRNLTTGHPEGPGRPKDLRGIHPSWWVGLISPAELTFSILQAPPSSNDDSQKHPACDRDMAPPGHPGQSNASGQGPVFPGPQPAALTLSP